MKKEKRTDIVARADDAFGSANYAEYVVKKKSEGRYRLHRLLMLLAYLVVIGGMIALFVNINPFMIGIAPILGWILYYFTWPMVSLECKYTVDGSVFSAMTVYGGKKDKVEFSGKVKDFVLIAPDNSEFADRKSEFAAQKTVSLLPSSDCEDRYFGLYQTSDGEKTMVLFCATHQALKALKYYNSAATVMSEVSR